MTLKDPLLVPKDSLTGVQVGVSVSESADLGRLGLSNRHINLAAAEIARAVLLAGGSVVYGGRPEQSGFTDQLISEVARFGTARESLTLVAAWPDWATRSVAELREVDQVLGVSGRLIALDLNGQATSWTDGQVVDNATIGDEQRATAYSAQRAYMTRYCAARIVLGGRLQDYSGSMPGVLEECLLAVEAGQPLYLAGGFGGAAAACARALEPTHFDWLPENLPANADDPKVSESLARISIAAQQRNWTAADDGLSADQRALLRKSHRPGEIASLSILGLATALAEPRQVDPSLSADG